MAAATISMAPTVLLVLVLQKYLVRASPCPASAAAEPPTHQEKTVRLMRIGRPGAERPVALREDGTHADLSGVLDPATAWSFEDLERARAALADAPTVDVEGERVVARCPVPASWCASG